MKPAIFGGKPIIRGHRLAVEHVLDMLAVGDDIDTIVEGYPWMERADVLACIEYARPPRRSRASRALRHRTKFGVKLLFDSRVWGGARVRRGVGVSKAKQRLEKVGSLLPFLGLSPFALDIRS